MKSLNMRVALAQTEIVWENKEENYKAAEKWIKEASANSTDLILFPEMSFTGFTMNTAYSAETDDQTNKIIRKIAKEYDISIGYGWVKKAYEKAENHYSIVTNKGEIISDYIKIHPFSYSRENNFFVGGTTINHFEIFGIQCSNFICYDLRFPEIFQIASEIAHVIIIPANWPKARREHWKVLLRARAIENQVYILAINCFGKNIGGLEYSGDSCVINPNGDIVAYAEGNELLYYDLTDDILNYRNPFPVKQDRKTALYKELQK